MKNETSNVAPLDFKAVENIGERVAANYSVLIHSFDGDYYYGVFKRGFSDGTQEFIANLHLEFDEQDDDFPHSYLEITGNHRYNVNSQVRTDFEAENDEELEDKLSAIVIQHAKEIFQSVKKDGKNWEMCVA